MNPILLSFENKMKKGKVIEKIDHHSKFSIESQVMTLKRVKVVLNSYWYNDGLLITNVWHFMKQNADFQEGISQA